MIKTNLTLVLFLLFNGFLNAQVNDSKKCDCDSLIKTKMESHITFAFAGRAAKILIKPDNNTCEIGKFSFDISVNRKGEVIQADFNKKKSSKISGKLKSILTDAAMKSKFMDKDDAPSKQKGNITYSFQLKEKISST